MAESRQSAPELSVYYMKLIEPNYDARLGGKQKVGQVVPMSGAQATRYLTAKVAEQASEGEYDEQQGRKKDKATAAQNAFRAINEGGAVWDVSTYRDVLTAPEGGLRLARERNIPLVNVHMLRDEDGDPLPPDAEIDEILDARALLHADLQSPFSAHERSSVMGGGSPYVNTVNPGGPLPLSPSHRATVERIAEHEAMAQRPIDYERKGEQSTSSGGERVNRATRRGTARPAVSPEADKAARESGVVQPSNALSDEQKA